MKVEWLDRTLIVSPVYYMLATSRKLLDQELKRSKISCDIGVPVGKSACTYFLTNEKKEVVAIVCLFDYKTVDLVQAYALLVHEAVHIYQVIRDNLGEKNPSHEFEAYSIQSISQRLMYEFNRQTKKVRPRGKKSRR